MSESVGNHRIVSESVGNHRIVAESVGNHTKVSECRESHNKVSESVGNHTTVSEYNTIQNVTDLPGVEEVRVVFGRSEEELDPLGELDSAERGVGEVEEDSQDHGYGDQPQTLAGQES